MTVTERRGNMAGLLREAAVVRAEERLVRIKKVRAAWKLHRAGASQREIADQLGISQPSVHRILKLAELQQPTDISPEELILQATVDGSSRDDLVKRLSSMSYTFGSLAPWPFDGATTGTWDQVVASYATGLLSADEFKRVESAVTA